MANIISNPTSPQSITGESLTLTSSAPLITQGGVTTNSLNKVVYADQQSGADAFAQIATAIALLPSGGTVDCRGFGAGVQLVATPLSITTSNITLLGDPSVVFEYNAAGEYIDISSASNVVLDGLCLDGSGAGMRQQAIVVGDNGAVSNITIRNCRFQNFPTTSDGVIEVTQTTDFSITDCFFEGNYPSCIFVNGNVGTCTYGVITNNTCDLTSGVSGATGVMIHSTGPGNTCMYIVVSDNIIINAPNFAIEVGAFGGSYPVGVTITGNVLLLPASCAGGVSLSGTYECTVTGNMIEGSSAAVSIGGIELAGNEDITVTANTLNLGTGSTYGIVLDPDNSNVINVTVTGNQINFSGSSFDAGIYVVATGTSSEAYNVTIANNVITFPSAGAGQGINLHSQTSGSTIQFVSILGNTVIGNGDGSSSGVSLNNIAGTLANVSVRGNTIYNCNVGLYDTGAYTYISDNKFNSCSTDATLSGSNTVSDIWMTYTPTATSSTGSFTTVSATGLYAQIGNRVHFQVAVTITNAGTASGALEVTLPVASTSTAAALFALAGREAANTGDSWNGIISPSFSTTKLLAQRYDGGTSFSNGMVIVLSGTYQNAL